MTRMHSRPQAAASRLGRTALAMVACALALPAAAGAALGDLDPSFDGGGIALVQSGASGNLARVHDLLADPAARPVLAAQAFTAGGGSNMLLSRLATAGRTDWVTPLAGSGGEDARLVDVVRQPDGRLVATGSSPVAGSDLAVVVRVLDSGVPDDSFGTNGQQVLDIAPASRAAGAAVFVLADGDLLVVGDTTDELLVARLDPDGSFDRAFGSGSGFVLLPLPGAEVHAAMLDPQGRLLVGGRAGAAFVARLDVIAQGAAFDPSYGSGGVGVFGDASTAVYDLAVLPDAAILAVGQHLGAGLAARLSPAGTLEQLQTHRAGAADTVFTGVALDAAGRPMVGGLTQGRDPADLVLARLDERGLLDPVLDAGGVQPGIKRVPVAGGASSGGAIAVDGDGRALLGGSAGGQLVVTRHLPNAAPTAAFTGPATLPPGQESVFDAAASTDPERALRRYEWDFDGDGTFETDGGTNPGITRSFPTAGTRRVTLRVTDHAGLQATAARDVAVQAQLPGRPRPVLGKSAVVEPVSGVVRIWIKGSRRYVPLESVAELPEGSHVDARRGRVRLTVARNRAGDLDSADFYLGRFRFSQTDNAAPYTTVELIGGKFPPSCGKTHPKLKVPLASASAARRKSRRVIRRLWGDGNGRFRTKGRYASATVRGTKWQTIDRCDGVLLRVERGVVAFRDLLRATRARTVTSGGRDFVASKRNP